MHSVLAVNAGDGLIAFIGKVEGGNLSPQELQGKYTLALGRIAGKTASAGSDRNRPIFRRNPEMSEQQAIQEAARALTALWKIRRSEKA